MTKILNSLQKFKIFCIFFKSFFVCLFVFILSLLEKSVLFVCLGNICRSPAAEGICRALNKNITVDSCATGGWHTGQSPDSRSQKACKKHGVDISSHRARTIKKADWSRFTVIAALDNELYSELQYMKPKDAKAKLVLFNAPNGIDDPYYGGPEGFDRMYDLISSVMPKFLEENGLA